MSIDEYTCLGEGKAFLQLLKEDREASSQACEVEGTDWSINILCGVAAIYELERLLKPIEFQSKFSPFNSLSSDRQCACETSRTS